MAKLYSTSLTSAARPESGDGQSDIVDRIAAENQARLAALAQQASAAAAGRQAHLDAASVARQQRATASERR